MNAKFMKIFLRNIERYVHGFKKTDLKEKHTQSPTHFFYF